MQGWTLSGIRPPGAEQRRTTGPTEAGLVGSTPEHAAPVQRAVPVRPGPARTGRAARWGWCSSTVDVPEPPVGTLIGQEMVRRPVPREVRVPAAAPLISVVLSAPVVASGGTRRGDPVAAVFGEPSGAALPRSRSLVPRAAQGVSQGVDDAVEREAVGLGIQRRTNRRTSRFPSPVQIPSTPHRTEGLASGPPHLDRYQPPWMQHLDE